jgi:hypothetical protein
MSTHAAKAEKCKAATVAERATVAQNQHQGPATVVDNRPAAVAQRQMQAMINQSPQVQQAATLQARIAQSPRQRQAAQRKMAAPAPVQKKANKTGLPNELKAGVEHLSGHSLDDVQVHYKSAKPAQLQAHAYAQGTDIYIAPGQEKHLPHEAWHVVQQKQGRVRPTMKMKGQVAVNNDVGLEREADVMGGQIAQRMPRGNPIALGLPDVGAFLGQLRGNNGIYSHINMFSLRNHNGYSEVHVHHFIAGGVPRVTMAVGQGDAGRVLAPAGLAASAIVASSNH